MPKAGAASKADYKKYRQWYLDREASPEGVKKRGERAQARALLIKAGKLTGKSDPREADHIRSLAKGGANRASNLQPLSRTANRKKYTKPGRPGAKSGKLTGPHDAGRNAVFGSSEDG